MQSRYNKKDKPEIVFFCPPAPFTRGFEYYSLGVAYIQAYLLQKNIFSMQIKERALDTDSLVKRILSCKPRIVGLTCYDLTYFLVKTTAKLLKERDPGLKIIIGGPTATFSDSAIMKDCPQIDICVRTEGEVATYEIIQSLKGAFTLSGIQGITYRDNGKIIPTPDRPLLALDKKGAELDVFPSPYLSPILTGREQRAGILTSRGCAFHCIYCSSPAMWRFSVRCHSIERVISEIRQISRNVSGNTDKIKISVWDDHFTFDTNRAKEICKRIIKERLNKNLEFYCELRADRADSELLGLLREAGFIHVNFGLESAVPRVLKIMKKVRLSDNRDNTLTAERSFLKNVKENVKYAKSIGLNPTVSIITGSPGETLEEGRRTIEFVKMLNPSLYYHNRLLTFPGTELFRRHKDFGFKVAQPFGILPYYLKYSYEISKIPYGKNSFATQIMYIISRLIIDTFFDSIWALSKEGLPLCRAILFKNFYDFDERLSKWLRLIVTMGGPVIFFYNKRLDEEFAVEKIRQMYAADIPTAEYYFLFCADKKGVSQKPNRYELVFKAGLKHHGVLPFVFDSVAFSRINTIYNNGHKEREVILTLNSKKDRDVFKDAFKKENRCFKGKGIGKLIDLNAFCHNSCMWRVGECPALTLGRLIVTGKGLLTPCLNMPPFGKVGDAVSELDGKLRQRFNRQSSERGCLSCVARNRCSKCFNPYPFSPKEFCDIMQRQIPDIGSAMHTVDILRDFELQKSIGLWTDII